MPSHYTHGPDYLDKDKKKKKKFSYKTEKAKLDSQMSNYHKEMERLKQERLKKEAKKKREDNARKLVEAEEKKWMKKHGIKRTTNDRIPKITKRVAPVKKGTAVKLKHKAKKK